MVGIIFIFDSFFLPRVKSSKWLVLLLFPTGKTVGYGQEFILCYSSFLPTVKAVGYVFSNI